MHSIDLTNSSETPENARTLLGALASVARLPEEVQSYDALRKCATEAPMDLTRELFRHRLAANLHRHQVVANVPLPEEITTPATLEYEAWTIRGDILLAEYLRLLELLGKAGVKAVVLKGVHMAPVVYQDLGLRPFSDLDVLVAPEDYETSFDVLRSAGYSQGDYDPENHKVIPFSPERIRGYELELQHFGEFRKAAPSRGLRTFSVDVHHRLHTKFDTHEFDVAKLMNRSVSYECGGLTLHRLSDADALVHMAVHLLWHTQSLGDILSYEANRILRHADIRLWWRKAGLTWDQVTDAAREARAEEIVRIVLWQTEQIFGDVLNQHDRTHIQLSASEHLLIDTIADRWINRNTAVPVGHWSLPFPERIVAKDRADLALRSFYLHWVEPGIRRGDVLEWKTAADRTPG